MTPGASITLLPTTFHRPPFSRLPRWHTKGTVRRVIGRENGRVLLEVELEDECFVCWDSEIMEHKQDSPGEPDRVGGG